MPEAVPLYEQVVFDIYGLCSRCEENPSWCDTHDAFIDPKTGVCYYYQSRVQLAKLVAKVYSERKDV